MIAFFTCNPCINNKDNFYEINDFTKNLKESLSNKNLNVLFIASNPNDSLFTYNYSKTYLNALVNLGYAINSFNILDNKTINKAEEFINSSDIIFLAGGHCPTQNKFFSDINLKEHLKKFDKVLITISAGTMNSAKVVYAIPELEGEAVNKNYKKFLFGLGLINEMIIPDHKDIENDILDNLNILNDIVIPDSINKTFYIFKDGTYILLKDNIKTLYGKTYIVKNKEFKLFNNTNEVKKLGDSY